MATIQRFANPAWANGGYSIGGEKFARIKPIPGRLLGVRPKLETTTEADLVSRGIVLMAELNPSLAPSPAHRQAIFGPQDIRQYANAKLGGLKVSSWSEPQMRDFILNYLAPCYFYFDQANEAYDTHNPGETDYAVVDGMPQQEWMYAALRDKQQALNHRVRS